MARQLTPETQEALLRAAIEAGSERALARKLGVEYHVIGNALRQGCTRKNEEDLRRRLGMPPITPRTHTEGHRITVSHADYEEVLSMDYEPRDIWQLGMETMRVMETYGRIMVGGQPTCEGPLRLTYAETPPQT